MGNTTHKSTINNIIHNDKMYNNPQDISEIFNDFFSNVASNLEAKLPPSTTNPLFRNSTNKY